MLDSEYELQHKNHNNRVPEIGRIGESSNRTKNSIIQIFSYIFRAWYEEYHESNQDGRKRESMSTMEPCIGKITRFSYIPEESNKNSTGDEEKYIIPERVRTVIFFSPYENPRDDDSHHEMYTKYERIIRRKPDGNDSVYMRKRDTHKSKMQSNENPNYETYQKRDVDFSNSHEE